METYSPDTQNDARRLSIKSEIRFWDIDTDKTDEEMRTESRRRWEESVVEEFPEKPRKIAGLEDYEVAGVAQDPDGAEIPREGWQWSQWQPGKVIPKADNPLRVQLMKMQGTACFKIAANYLEHMGCREKMRC